MKSSQNMARDLADEQLMVLYQSGEVAAFEALYQRYEGRVYAFIRRRCASDTDAGDLVQQVFMKLHQSRDTYNPEYAFTQWLFTICRSSISDHYRTQKKGIFEELDTEVLEPSNAIKGLEARNHYKALIRTELNETAQEVVALRLFDEQSFAQISARLNLSQDNVRQIISRSFKRLKSVIERQQENSK